MDWMGLSGAEELHPARMQFTAQPTRGKCSGCAFDGQRVKVCDEAAEVAVRAGLPHCEQGKVIYLRTEVDPRQQSLIEADP